MQNSVVNFNLALAYACAHSVVTDSVTRWTVCSPPASLSMRFFRQEYRSGLPFPPPQYIPNRGTEPMSPALAGRFFTTGATWEALPLVSLSQPLPRGGGQSFRRVQLCDPMDHSPLGSSKSVGFSRQEYRSGLPFPPPGDLPHPGTELMSPAFFTTKTPGRSFQLAAAS